MYYTVDRCFSGASQGEVYRVGGPRTNNTMYLLTEQGDRQWYIGIPHDYIPVHGDRVFIVDNTLTTLNIEITCLKHMIDTGF